MTNDKQRITLKRLLLVILTVLAVFNVGLSLFGSLNQPQVQSRLELYQTHLLLKAAELKTENTELKPLIDAAIGENPYETGQKQYEEAIAEARSTLEKLRDRRQQLVLADADSQTRQQLEEAIAENQTFIGESELELGILQARESTETAQRTWQELRDRPKVSATAAILQQIWSDSPSPPLENVLTAETQIEQTLEGWFRDRALHRLYEVENRAPDLAQLEIQEQLAAREAVQKLAIVGGIPAVGGLFGVIIAIILLVQLALRWERSLLAISETLKWEVPWDGEVIWQVLIVGFFFVGQFVLPILFGLIGLDPTGYNLRQKAILVLASYILLAIAGLSILYISIKPYFPLPEDWFRFKLLDKWVIWGIGGYFTAIPLVIVVSLVNQQFWDGQGGSNPILSLALQAQDFVALAIFFFTASVAAPVFEEIIFRGFLLPSLTRYLPVWGAIVVSAFVFAVAHLSLSEVLPLATLGIVLGFAYTRSRNLLSSILIHSLWNSGTLLTLFVLGS
ncbi:MAG: CPBP family glutamic-type intramembrane protease [Cyanobacteriota bacterium]|nr:CPBP family glutamic-type intramembrane protease [Cyanobacteriota bacterium]